MPIPDKTIPHESKVRAVVTDQAGEDFVVKVGGTIATPASPGSSYVQAEVVALRTAIASILTKLQASGLID